MTWNHFLRNCPFVRGIHRLPVDSPHKGPVTQSVDGFFHVRPNERLGKQRGWLWFEMPWCSRNDIVMKSEDGFIVI